MLKLTQILPHVEKVLHLVFVVDRAEIQGWMFLNEIKPKDGLCSAGFHPREQSDKIPAWPALQFLTHHFSRAFQDEGFIEKMEIWVTC